MTFGGLALAVGRLVDDSIVELEAISRHYNERKPNQSKMTATLEAAKEVAAPIFISTLTTVIVFLPIVFLSGVAKLLFIPLTITITITLFGSFFVSRTVTPLMCLNFLPPEKHLNRESKKLPDRLRVISTDFIESLDAWYSKWLGWTLQNRKKVIYGILILAVVSIGLIKFIGTEFFPDQDEGQFTVTIRLPVGTRPEVTNNFCLQIEDVLRKNIPEIQAMITDVGIPPTRSNNFFGRNTGSHNANIQIALVPSDQRKRSLFDIIKDIRPKLNAIPGASLYIAPSGFLRFLLNFGANAPIDVEIRGFDLETGSALAKEVVNTVRSVPGATDVQSSREDNLPELRVRIDRDKAGILGIDVAQISNIISTCINGTVASLYSDPVNGNQYNILVRLSEDYRSNIDDLNNLVLTTNNGQQVLLGNIARIEKASSPVEIDRKYQQRLIDVTANVFDRDLGSVANDIQAKLDKLALPSGFEIKMTGNVEQQQKT
ncbi:MAG TPA: efflux RND transporter permease subunit, partial [Bacteroidota bacterium]|nr:efflux RND transporter permease subunit [Bacteroidota bacterium]